MMKKLAIGLLFFVTACGTHNPALRNHLDDLNETDLQVSYEALLKRIHQEVKERPISEIPVFLESCLRDSVFEYWYDTPWDFNGTTEVPRKGNIACGYFVTTTLKHLGLGIDRVYLAQQASSAIIKEVCDPLSVKVFTNLSYKRMKAWVEQYDGNIFIAGLDNHVGFIVKEANEMYFVHASGISPHKVVKEKCDESNLLVYSKYHMVGHINFARWAKSVKAGS